MRPLFAVIGLLTTMLLSIPAHAGDSATDATSLRWATATRSPQAVKTSGGRDKPLYELCGQRDLGLVRVAAAVVGRKVDRVSPPSQRQLLQLLRAAGVPQLWPRAWALAGDHDEAVIAATMQRWLAKKGHPVGARRCGVARGVDASGEPIVAAVVVDALADLSPLPMRVRAGRWMSLEATLHLPASQAKVVLLGPRGRPKRVLASVSYGKIRSRFALDVPGRWKVQVVASLPDGPKPVLEALVFAGTEPPEALADAQPDNDEVAPSSHRLLTLLNEARRRERLPLLRRDNKLAAVARAHVRAMMVTRRVAHDVGQGSPQVRAREAGIRAHNVGENVASAPSVSRVHHALWDSPSHRENMLDASFSRVGVALAIDRHGHLYAVQMFAD